MSASDTEHGLPMLGLLSSLAVALAFLSFSFGAVNAASARRPTTLPPPPPAAPAAERAALDATLARLQSEIAALERELVALQDKAAQVDGGRQRAQAAAADLERRLADLRRRVADEERRARSLEKAIDDARAVPVARLYGRSGGAGSEPQWAECVDGAVVLQPQGTRLTVDELKGGGAALLEAARRTNHVVFLIRPSGYPALLQARAVVERESDVKVGFEPVDEGWALRFGGSSR